MPPLYENLENRINFNTKKFRLADGYEISDVEDGKYIIKNKKNEYLRIGAQEKFIIDQLHETTSVQELSVAYFFQYGRLGDNFVRSFIIHLLKKGFLFPKYQSIYLEIARRLLEIKIKKSWGEKLKWFFKKKISKNVITLNNLDSGLSVIYKKLGQVFCHPLINYFHILSIIFTFTIFFFEIELFSFSRGSFSNLRFFSEAGSVTLGLLSIYAINIIVTFLHEFGHGISVKHFGRKVDKGGIVSHFGIPTFFVDTNDIWMRPRRERIIVSLAGPYSSLVLSSLVIWGMIFFDVGSFSNFLIKMVMWSCISAALNLNPFLLFDGYYVLVDLLKIPLLRQRALSTLKEILFFKGGFLKDSEERKKTLLLMVYAVLAIFWTAAVVVMTFIFLSMRFGKILMEFLQTNSVAIGIVSFIIMGFVLLPTLITISTYLFFKVKRLKSAIESMSFWKNYFLRYLFFLGIALLICVGSYWGNIHFNYLLWGVLGLLIAKEFIYYQANVTLTSTVWILVAMVFLIGVPLLFETQLLVVALMGILSLVALVGIYLGHGYRVAVFPTILFVTSLFNFLFAIRWSFYSSLQEVIITFNCFAVYNLLNLYNSFINSLRFIEPPPVQDQDTLGRGDFEKIKSTFDYIFRGIFLGLRDDLGHWRSFGIIGKLNDLAEYGISYHPSGIEISTRKWKNISELAPVLKSEMEKLNKALLDFVGGKIGNELIVRGMDTLDWIHHEVFVDFVMERGNVKVSQEGREGFLSHIKIFSELSDEELHDVVDALKLEYVEPDTEIIHEGEDGTEFFMILGGQLEVEKKGVRVAILSKGDIFGEKALITNSSRNATVRTLTRAKILIMQKKIFNDLMLSSESFKKKIKTYMNEEFKFYNEIASIGPLKNVDREDLVTLCENIQFKHFDSGDIIIEKGDSAESFYIIKSGEVETYIEDPSGEERVIATLGGGEFFGEIAMLQETKRTANVRALGATVLYQVTRENFSKVLSDSWNMERISTRRLKEMEIQNIEEEEGH